MPESLGPLIGFWGGVSLLMSSITGPGLTTIPLLFQEAGWLTPLIGFQVFSTIAGLVATFLIETMVGIRGNEKFQSRVEYSTIVQLYLGDRAHAIMQVLLFCSLQSVNMASIIIAAQTMDSILVTLGHKTCAISFTQGFICVHQNNPGGSPFDSYIVVSLGYLMAGSLVVPLSLMTLAQNIKFQLASAASLCFIVIIWVIVFVEHGLNESIPVVGHSQTTLVGFILNNFAFVTTIPSFVNELSPSVSIQRVVWYSIMACVIMYLVVGITGAAALEMNPSSELLATLSGLKENSGLIVAVNIMFPITVLITSVPVFAIVIRYNLVRGNICSEGNAKFLASVLPWILIIPFQTKGWLLSVMNWSSLIFGSTTNFIIPLILFIVAKKRASRSSILPNDDLLHVYNESASRRSSHIVERAREPIPSIITPSAGSDAIPLQDLAPPTFTLQPPSDIGPELSHSLNSIGDSKDNKDTEPGNELAKQSNQGTYTSRLDPFAGRRGFLHSPAASRSGSITETDRPSGFLAERKAEDGAQLIPTDTLGAGSRIRSNSFEARPNQDGTVHRRNLSRNNSSDSATGLNISAMGNIAAINQTTILGSSNRHRRLTIEEVAEESEEGADNVTLFKALPEYKWLSPTLVAKLSLTIIVGAVIANIIFAIKDAVKSHSFLSS